MINENYEYLIEILNKVPGHLYWKNKQGIYLGCNVMQANFLGLDSVQSIYGKTDFDLPWKQQAEYLREIDRYVMQTENEHCTEEIVQNSLGERMVFLSKKNPFYDPHTKEIIGIIGTSIDITKQKQAELAKQEFLQNMAHDIRTPFCGITSVLETLLNKESNKEKKEWLEMAWQSSQYALQFLNDVYEISQNAHFALNKTKFNLKQLIKEVILLFTSVLQAKKLSFEHEYSGAAMVHTDRFRIQQIVLNLLSNAIKFTHKGVINLSVVVDDCLLIKIQDTGIGIAKRYVQDIFQDCFKIVSSYKQSTYKGIGKGLFLTKKHVEALHGKISVTSKLGEGSIFSVAIPDK